MIHFKSDYTCRSHAPGDLPLPVVILNGLLLGFLLLSPRDRLGRYPTIAIPAPGVDFGGAKGGVLGCDAVESGPD